MTKKVKTPRISLKSSQQKILFIAIAALVIGLTSYIGVHNNRGSHAATGDATLTIPAPTHAYSVGDTIPVVIQVNSGTAISTIEAAMTYPSSQLTYAGVTEGTLFTTQQRTNDNDPAGTLDIIRGLPGGHAGVTGTNVVITVNFTVKAVGSGTAAINFTNASGVYDSATGSLAYDAANSHGASFTLQLPAPSITSIAPTSGLTTGGTAVTITGSNFVSGATVTVGGTAATNVVVVNSTTITAKVPAHAVGPADVIVKNPDGQLDTLTSGFVYGNPAPTVTSIAPASGLTTGGTNVTITGTGFIPPVTVKIGGVSATNVALVSSTTISATAPVHAAGVADVQVVNSDGQSATKTSAFTFVNPAPTITSVSPVSGVAGGGMVVTITGSNFMSGATVTFGGTVGTNISVTSGTTISVVAPSHASGAVDIVVKNPDGQSATKAAGFSYASLGDDNNDGHINSLDLSILLSHDGQNFPAADFNNDGTVGAADLAILLSHWTW
jgi:hypothetical protein